MMTTTNTAERPNPPKSAYDKEYATQFRKEMEYLKECGIEPTYTRRGGTYHIPTYKYTKTPELFKVVAEFYEQQRNEKMFDTLATAVKAASEIDVWSRPV